MKLPFSETWVISLVSRPDRYKKIRKQIDWFGWDVKDHRVVIHPHCDKIADSGNKNGWGYLNSPNAFSCTREHYTLIKSAYLRGLESICIIEDDVSFLLNKDIWESYMSNLPEDWDILRICSLRGGVEEDYINSRYPKDNWVPVFSGMWGTGCYALSRNGMKYMIDAIDSLLQPIDNPLYHFKSNPSISHYLPNIPLGLCMEDSLTSDINLNSPCNFYFKDIKFLNKNKDQYNFKKGVVFFIAHEITEFTKKQYQKLKNELKDGYDIIWWLDDNCPVSIEFSKNIKYIPFPHNSIQNKRGYISPTRYFETVWEKENLRYNNFWFVEYDVYYSGNWGDFIEKIDTIYNEDDLIASYLQNKIDNLGWNHWVDDITQDQVKSCLSIYRISNKGMRKLLNWNLNKIKEEIYELYIPTILENTECSLIALDNQISSKKFNKGLTFVDPKNYMVGLNFTDISQMTKAGKLYTCYKKEENEKLGNIN